MTRSENYLVSIFRRRNSRQQLDETAINQEAHTGNDKEEKESKHGASAGAVDNDMQAVPERDEERIRKFELEQSQVIALASTILESSTNPSNDEDSQESMDYLAPLESTCVVVVDKDSGDEEHPNLDKSSLSVPELPSRKVGPTTKAGDDTKEDETHDATMIYLSIPQEIGHSRFGWTRGRIRVVDERKRLLEPVVATGAALEEISLDECLLRAMAGKRGSFSSELSVKTDESESSEIKRRRMFSSVFRMRAGSGG